MSVGVSNIQASVGISFRFIFFWKNRKTRTKKIFRGFKVWDASAATIAVAAQPQGTSLSTLVAA